MKKLFGLLSMVGAVLLLAAPVLAAGEFYVIAGGGGVGTKITSLPYTITQPGFYYLTGNLTYTGYGDGITVASDDVTIALMGFRILNSGFGVTGISLYDGTNGHTNVEVRNGTLSGWEAGGLIQPYTEGLCTRALNLRVNNCGVGIEFQGPHGGNLIKGCTADACYRGIFIRGGVASGNTVSNCGYGIECYNGTISHNSVSNFSVAGISCYDASSIIGNTITATSGTPIGIIAYTGIPSLVTQNTVSGPGTHFSGGVGSIVNVANAGF